MAYQVLARKWRPKNFDELIGQQSVQQTLTNALLQNRVYPVLLFTGPRGTGKTSTARILAKTLCCQNKVQNQPCNQCQECLLIQDGKSLNVIEIDGASNNGVDAVRDLRDTISYMPSQGSHKVYIIDEVHMLSNSAFNALLKTLEEPPEHVIFVLATTEAHKIPQTVASRSQKLDFHLISPVLIKDQLEKIAQNENISLDEKALWLIAKQAQGSLRDAQSLLDQMITFCGQKITTEKVVSLLGLMDSELIVQCLQAIIQRNDKQMLQVIKGLASKGCEPKIVLQSLIEGLRDLLLLKVNPDNQPLLVQSSQEEIDQLKKMIHQTSYQDLHFLFDMVLKGEREIFFSSDSQLVLEILLLRFCQSPQLEDISSLALSSSPAQADHSPKKKASANLETQNIPRPASSLEVQKTTVQNFETQTSEIPKQKSQHFESQSVSQQTKTQKTQPSETQKTQPSETQKTQVQSSETQKTQSSETQKTQPSETQKTQVQSSETQKTQSSETQFSETQKTQPSETQNITASYTHSKSQIKSTLFDQFAFVDFLKKQDPLRGCFFENLSFKEQIENTFIYRIPSNFSSMKKEMLQAQNHQFFEDNLNQFLKTKNKFKIKFEISKQPSSTLKEEKDIKDQNQLFQKIQKNPFLKEVNKIFKTEIKNISKDTSDTH